VSDSSHIRIVVDGDADDFVGEMRRAKTEMRSATTQMAADARRASGVYQDAAGRWREANGRFVTSARQVELGLKQVAAASDKASAASRNGARATRQQTAAVDGLRAALRKQQQTLHQVNQTAKTTSLILGGGVSYGLIAATKAGIGFDSQMEQNRIALDQLTGSSKSANKLLADLFTTARKTPFEFAQITDAAKKFLAFGFSVKDTEKNLNAIGNAVSALGGGAEKIDRLTIALGQIQAKGRLQGDELLQLAEAGVPAYEILREKLKLTAADLKNIGNVAIPSKVAIDALVEGMQERFAGMTSRQSKSFAGLWSSIKDDSRQALGAITQGLFTEMKKWEPALDKTAQDIADIWKRKDLTPEQKFAESRKKIEKDLGPMFATIKHQIDQAHIGQHLEDAFNKALPIIADEAGKAGIKAASAFGHAFVDSSPLGRLVLATWFLSKTGGLAAFRKAGAKATGEFATGAAGSMTGGTGGATLKSTALAWGKQAGIAAAAGFAIAYGPDVVKHVGRGLSSTSQDFNLPKHKSVDLGPLNGIVNDIAPLRAFRDLVAPHGNLGKDQGEELKRFGDNAEGLRKKLEKLGDTRALAELADQASYLAKAYPDASRELTRFATTIEDELAGRAGSAFQKMHDAAGKSLSQIRQTVGETSFEIQNKLGFGTKTATDAMASNFKIAARAVQASMDAGVISTKTGTAEIDKLMRKYLAIYGISGKEATNYLAGKDPTTGKSMPSNTSHTNAARGAFFLGSPNEAGRDTVPMNVNGQPVIAARGEMVGIFNRHQRRKLDRMVQQEGYSDLRGFFAGNTTPHYMASGGMFESTAYGPPWNAMEGSGQTASGIKLPNGPTGHAGPYIVAVDPSVVPMHSKLKIWPNPFGYRGDFQAEDTGGAIKGNRVDFLDMIGRSHQNAWGRRMVQVLLDGMGGSLDMTSGGGGAVQKIRRILAQGVGGALQGIVQGGLDSVRHAAQDRLDQAAATQPGTTSGGTGGGLVGSGAGAPHGTVNIDGKPVAAWIAPIIQWAKQHGWHGAVTSGYRTDAQQIAAASHYGLGHYPNGPLASNHVRTDWPGGAVDVTDPSGLAAVLANYHGARNLVWGGPVMGDYVHFSANGHARGGLIEAALGFLDYSGKPGTADDPQSVTDWLKNNPVSSRAPDKAKAKAKAHKKKTGRHPRKRKPAKPQITGPGRPSLKVGAAKKKRGGATRLPAWLAALTTSEDAFSAVLPDLGGLYDTPIDHIRQQIATLEDTNSLTDEQFIVTLPDGTDVVNENGMVVNGRFMPGINQAVSEYMALLGLHAGVTDGKVNDPAAPGSLLGMLLGERNQIDATSLPRLMGDKDAVAKRLKVLQKTWEMRSHDRKLALAQARKLSSHSKGWQDQVTDNNTRIDRLRKYQREIHTAITNAGGVAAPEAKRNLQWAANQIADLEGENKTLKKDKPAAGGAHTATKIAHLRAEALQAGTELDAITGTGGRDADTFTMTDGLAGQWKARMDWDNSTLADLISQRDTLSLTDIPQERNEIQRLLNQISDATGTTLPPAPSTGDSTVMDDLLRTQRNDALRELAVSESQRLVVQGFAPLLNARMVGSFARGALRIPETGLAMVHKDETILSDPQGPFGNTLTQTAQASPVTVSLRFEGDSGNLVRLIDARVDGRSSRVVSEQLGRRSRVLRIAPGG
jgi:tape measure domain-containing protein